MTGLNDIPAREDDTSWRVRAACAPGNTRYRMAQIDTWMFPKDKVEIRKRRWAKVCRPCPVKEQCAAWGELTNGEGVYGGEFRRAKADENLCPDGHPFVPGEDCRICAQIGEARQRQAVRAAEAEPGAWDEVDPPWLH